MDIYKNKKENKWITTPGLIPAIVLGIFIVVAISLLFVAKTEFKEANTTIKEQGSLIQALEEDVDVLQISVDTLVKESETQTKLEIERRISDQAKIKELENKITSESTKRAELEIQVSNQSGLSASRIAELERELGSEYNSPTIISEWRKRTANVNCEFPLGTASGSGVLVKFNELGEEFYGVLTNKHVLTDTFERAATSCSVSFPDISGVLTGYGALEKIQVSSDDFDFGRIILSNPSSMVRSLAISEQSYCTDRPNIGDELIIIGYPVIGSSEDITATEGIISSFEGNYFVTSAKVEQGNSGGTAVLLNDNCFLGVPTFVQSGFIESLARILNVNVLKTGL